MVEIPGSLVERLTKRQAVLIAGLGCSELVGAPGWVALTEWLAARLVFSDARETIARLVSAGRLADANALIRDLLPHPVLEEALREAFPDGGPLPDNIRQVAAFPWRAVVATAFGDLWERALGASSGATTPPPVLVGTDELAEARATGARTPLLHLFGRIAEPESLCLGPADARTRLASAGGLAWLENLGRRRSFVFVGFRPSDPDLAWLSAWLAARPSRSSSEGPHFVFLDLSSEADPDTEASLLALRTGLEVIPCLGGTAEAIDRLARATAELALEIAPSDADVDVESLLRRWEENPHDPEPRAVLERAARALAADERWDRLIELDLRRLDLLDDPDEQRAMLQEIARVFRDVLGVPERALTAGIAALRIRPDDDELWEELRADARAAGAWERLLTGAGEAARAAGATAPAARIWRELAAILRDELARPEEALAALREALAAEPGHVEARDAEADLLRALERWDELVAALKNGARESTEPQRAAGLMIEAAEVLETKLGDIAGALAAYEAALVMTPEAEGIALMLERLYEREKRWSELASLLDRRASRLPAAEATELRRRRIDILVEQLDALDVAAHELEALLDEDPTDRPTLERLEGIYRRADRHDDVLRTLRRRADVALAPSERLALLRQVAAEAAGRPEARAAAAEALARVLELEPRDPEAFPALVRLYQALGEHGALVAARARRLEVTESAEARRELWLGQAESYDRDLGDPVQALAAYLELERSGDRREEIYGALARLAESLKRWDIAAQALRGRISVAEAPEGRAALLLEAARLHQERLADAAQAEADLRSALELVPGHVGALTALGRLCRDRGNIEEAAGALVEAAAGEDSPAAKAGLYAEAAALVEERLGQGPRAIDLYTRALAADPGHRAASDRLIEMHSGRREWAEVEALLDIRARSFDEAGDATATAAGERDDQRLDVYARLGAVCLELGKTDKAIDCLAKAHALAPEALSVLKPLAKLRFARGEWEDAQKLYESLLRLHRAALSPEEALDALLCLGRCASELDEPEEAIRRYQEARTLDPRHRPALEALCALHAGRKDWRDWVDDRQELVELAAKDERATLWEEIGDACADRLGDRPRAEEAYRAALEAEPNRRSALMKLLDVQTKADRWKEAAETLAELARLETDPLERAKQLYKGALVARDGIGDRVAAIALLERCLDDDPRLGEAWEDLAALHEAASDWKGLAASLRRMLERLPADAPDERRHKLWSRLADVALERLRDGNLAITALETATRLDPTDIARQATLARLYEGAGPGAREQAIAAHQGVLARDPDRLDSYQALAKLYGEAGELDKQWCLAAALAFLGRADPATEAVFKRHRPPQMRFAKHTFSEEIWRRTRHPSEDPLLDELFALVAPALSAAVAQAPQSFGLRRRQRVDLATDTNAAGRVLAQLAETMRLPRPDLFTMEGDTGQTTLLNVQEKGKVRPTLLLGPATLRRASFDIVFELATYLAFLRPERSLRFAFPTPAGLEYALRIALTVAGTAPAAAGPPGGIGGPGETGRLAEQLRRVIAPPALAEIAEVGRKLMARGQAFDVAKWSAGTDLSAARVALLLAGDLGAAARVITGEPIPTSPVPVRKRLADLVAFSASEEYFACRRSLGLHLAQPPATAAFA